MSLFCPENFDLHEVLLSKTELSWGNNLLDAAASIINVFLCGGAYISSTQLNSPKEETQPISTRNTLRFQKYSFPKLTQLSQKNNVPDALASNTDDFLSGNTCISST
jgi:hypothetical protein